MQDASQNNVKNSSINDISERISMKLWVKELLMTWVTSA